ncbi:transforming growth factor beta receptor type 3-like [Watersipora subatra]|uniref:transforming growth factor beta receptor type 3-like n=1 Tax=Watersipora subatra TaxID=2589382 RepID=UPI00355C6271
MNSTTALQLVTVMAAAIHMVASRSKHEEVFLDEDAFLYRNIHSTTKVLKSSMKVDCTKDELDVSFRKIPKVIELGVVNPTQLSLASSECKAQVNQSHFNLHTKLEDCDTKIIYSSNYTVVTIENKVVITTLMTSLPDDEDAAERNVPVEIPITCSFGSGRKPPGSEDDSHELTIERAAINLYNTDSYVIEVDTERGIPRGTSLYAKVTAWSADNKEQNFVLHSCYWSCRREVHYLIKNGCSVDKDVQFKEDSTEAPRKFLLRARMCGSRPTQLYCTLAACSPTQSAECETQEEYCNKEVKTDTQRMIDASLPDLLTVVKRPSRVPQTQEKNHVRTPLLTTVRTSSHITSEATSNRPKNCTPVEPEFNCICNVPSDKTGATMVSLEWTIVIAVFSFLFGVGITAMVRFCHAKTEPHKTMQSVSISDDGLSSQDSAAPTEKLMNGHMETTSSDESS